MTFIAVKEFLKKATKFVVDQWLFFLAAVIGFVGFIIGFRGSSDKTATKILDASKEAESEEREAREEAQERSEEILKDLGTKMEEIASDEKEKVREIIEENKEEFKKEIIENKEKPLEDIAKDLADKYGLKIQ